MNEKLIKELVRLKVEAADIILEQLPSELSKEIRSFGRLVMEALDESLKDIKTREAGKTAAELNNIPVE